MRRPRHHILSVFAIASDALRFSYKFVSSALDELNQRSQCFTMTSIPWLSTLI